MKYRDKTFNLKKEALNFIENKISFKNPNQNVTIIYRNKKWVVIYGEDEVQDND